ncbi:hypothetical protein SDC9_157713 [bioreactor metagenome]|uniref:Uncharacterized protein n=1 Tax=bioreactor metagenome TaxID=1076179 RepID=A0A645F7T0_9ZZZZ
MALKIPPNKAGIFKTTTFKISASLNYFTQRIPMQINVTAPKNTRSHGGRIKESKILIPRTIKKYPKNLEKHLIVSPPPLYITVYSNGGKMLKKAGRQFEKFEQIRFNSFFVL